MTAEEWRPVPGFSGYEVSNTGRVRSFKRPRARGLRPFSQQLRGGISTDGYRTVRLYSGVQVSRTECVHRLVCQVFIGPRPPQMEVRHLDGDKLNNCLSNLTYGTRSENQLDNVLHGVHPGSAKTHCANGHPFSDDNTYWHRGRHRQCRTCRLAATRRHRARLLAPAAP